MIPENANSSEKDHALSPHSHRRTPDRQILPAG
jgi:hypothetical protein